MDGADEMLGEAVQKEINLVEYLLWCVISMKK